MTRSVEKPSVIITCYNLSLYIAEAIRSVVGQDYDVPFEVIVVDDCSTDRSAEIIRAFPEVRYVRTETNSGVLLATVTGLEAATGDLIFFLDGDDVWEPGKFAAVCGLFASDPGLAFVTHDLTYVDNQGAALDRPTLSEKRLTKAPASQRGALVREGILMLGDFVWLGSAMAIRSRLADAAGFCTWAKALPDPRNTYQDWPLAYWIAAIPSAGLGYVPAKLFRYRLHQLNYSGDARTAEQALRNLRRTRNSTQAMKDIAARRNLPASVHAILGQRAAFIDYLIDLNSGRRLRAAKGLLRSFAYLRSRDLVAKELARFAAIQLLGVNRFAKFASRRTVLRNLPAS